VPTTILLARHGETDWNRDHRWQGHTDAPLNETGLRQAEELAGRLAGEDLAAIYASDLERALRTAEIVAAGVGAPVRSDPRLRERSFGGWEGLTSAEVRERFPAEFERWHSGDGHGLADAEPYEAVVERVREAILEIAERHPDGTVLVVAHGGPIRVVHALARGLDFRGEHSAIPRFANCEVSRCGVRDGVLAPLD
jgi:broad specificity phosphatase PhoE